MHGINVDSDVRAWFDVKVPRSTVNPRFVELALQGIEVAPVVAKPPQKLPQKATAKEAFKPRKKPAGSRRGGAGR